MTVMKGQCAEFQIPIGLGNIGQRAYSLMYYKLLNLMITITIIIIITIIHE